MPRLEKWEKFLTFKVEMKKVHLTREQRYTIFCLIKQGCTQTMIAEAIDKNKSVVSRELKRNANLKENIPLSMHKIQQKYEKNV